MTRIVLVAVAILAARRWRQGRVEWWDERGRLALGALLREERALVAQAEALLELRE